MFMRLASLKTRSKYGIVFTLLGSVLLGLSFDQHLVPAVLLAWCGVCFVILGMAYFTNNAAVFGKRPDGTLRWPESLLMMPYLLLAAVVWRVQNLFTDKCPWSGVAPNLYVGRRCSLAQLPPNTSGVIDVTAEFPTPRTLRQQSRVLVVPTLDGGAPSWSQCQQVADFVRTDPTGVYYVYCANGAGRSVTYVAILLGLKGLASSASEAIDSIRKARKVAAPNTDQRRFIEEVFKTQILQNGQTISSEVG